MSTRRDSPGTGPAAPGPLIDAFAKLPGVLDVLLTVNGSQVTASNSLGADLTDHTSSVARLLKLATDVGHNLHAGPLGMLTITAPRMYLLFAPVGREGLVVTAHPDSDLTTIRAAMRTLTADLTTLTERTTRCVRS